MFGGSGSGDEAENQEEDCGENDQQMIDAHFILDQIDDNSDSSRGIAISKSITPVTQAHFSNDEYCPPRKPRRTSLLFGVDLLDMRDSEAILQGIEINNFSNGQETNPTLKFFPGLHRNSWTQTDTDHFFYDNTQGAMGHEQNRFFKGIQGIWNRDAPVDNDDRLTQNRQEYS